MMQRLKGYRTAIAMFTAALPPFLDALLPVLLLPEWADVIPGDWWGVYSIAVSILGLYLRSITTTPMGQK